MIRKVTLGTFAALGLVLTCCGGEVETPARPAQPVGSETTQPVGSDATVRQPPRALPEADAALAGAYSGTDVAYMTVGWQEGELHGRGRVPWKEESYRLELRSDGTYTLTTQKRTVLRLDATKQPGSPSRSDEPVAGTREGRWELANGDLVLQEGPAGQEVWRVDRQEGRVRLERDGISLSRGR
jgi:hypothetical protein